MLTHLEASRCFPGFAGRKRIGWKPAIKGCKVHRVEYHRRLNTHTKENDIGDVRQRHHARLRVTWILLIQTQVNIREVNATYNKGSAE